jgi:Fe-S-cluster containining protein
MGRRSAPPRGTPWKDDPLRHALLALYQEVDALLDGHSCDSSTECCQFGVTGREPYSTAIEAREVRFGLDGIGGPRAIVPKARLPMAEATRPCPFLREGRCRIYRHRPFGCRTFFCDRRQGPARFPREAIADIARRIATLSETFDPRDPGARPLTNVVQVPRG